MVKRSGESHRRLLAKDNIQAADMATARKHTLQNCYPLHWHDFFELEFVLSGTGTQTLNGVVYPMRPGTAYFLSPADFHAIAVDGKMEVLNIMMHEDLVPEALKQKSLFEKENLLFYLPEPAFAQAKALGGLLVLECEAKLDFYGEAVSHLLHTLFLTVLRCTNTKPVVHASTPPLASAVSYLHIHFRENPSLLETARAVHVNPNYLSGLFSKELGQTYTAYRNGLKLACAKRLLRTSALSVTEICFAAGFLSLSHFLKTFQKAYGTSPANYRRETAPHLQKGAKRPPA